jgi:hypothetical protein
MASPVVVVLKGPEGKGGVRITVNYQYVNAHTVPDVPLPNTAEVIQKVGRAKYISLFDATSGYHHCAVKPEHQWLIGMVVDSDLYEWIRTPFGMRSSGCTFVRGGGGLNKFWNQ